jgi:hypothetical protein
MLFASLVAVTCGAKSMTVNANAVCAVMLIIMTAAMKSVEIRLNIKEVIKK